MKIETVDYTASDAGDRLARSLRETGFAVLANHPIRCCSTHKFSAYKLLM